MQQNLHTTEGLEKYIFLEQLSLHKLDKNTVEVEMEFFLNVIVSEVNVKILRKIELKMREKARGNCF